VNQSLGLVSLVVRDYDEAIYFFVGVLGFVVLEDSLVPEQDKRWLSSRRQAAAVVVPDSSSREPRRRSKRCASEIRPVEESSCFCIPTISIADYELYRSRGVRFVREPREEPYGTVAVFEDLYGNLWDLLEPTGANGKSPAPA
jgi:catechol 2,3-dioxygenase-like lactoylglutathione lyase family enzyme